MVVCRGARLGYVLAHAGTCAIFRRHAEWGLSENNRKAKFHRLTPTGRQQLRRETSKWERYADAVFKVLRPAEDS